MRLKWPLEKVQNLLDPSEGEKKGSRERARSREMAILKFPFSANAEALETSG